MSKKERLSELAKEIKEIGLRVFEPVKEKHQWLYVESKDGYGLQINMGYGLISVGTSYRPSAENGSGESLGRDLSREELMKLLEKPVAPLFFVRNAGERYGIEEVLEKSSFQYKEVNTEIDNDEAKPRKKAKQSRRPRM